MKPKQITPLQPSNLQLPQRKRVAAYARVSTDSENLLKSFAAQVTYYDELIRSRADWEYVGIYADRGISGTSTAHRDEFKRLLEDCDAGRIDLVLTKSISRFARNTVDLLNTVRHLRDIGVDVYFEEQRISSLSADGEFMLTLLASFAQAEAQSISDNVTWLIRKNFQQGIPNGHKRMLGYDWDGEKCIVISEEAAIVRRIFDSYVAGKSSVQIARELNEDEFKTIHGNPFTDYNVRVILENESYIGNLLLQKRYSPTIGKRAKNNGELAMYRVEEAHEPIIDTETFEAAQAIRRERAGAMPERQPSPFSGLLKCGYCGHNVCRRCSNNPKTKPVWLCNSIDKKGSGACGSRRRLPETELVQAVEEMGAGELSAIIVYDDRLEFRWKTGRKKTWPRAFTARSCFSRKVFCADCGCVYVRRTRNHGAVWRCKHAPNCPGVKSIPETLLETMARDVTNRKDYEMPFHNEVDKVLVRPTKVNPAKNRNREMPKSEENPTLIIKKRNGEMLQWQKE